MEVYICEQETPRIEFSRENNKLFDFSDHPNSSSAKIQGGLAVQQRVLDMWDMCNAELKWDLAVVQLYRLV